MCLVEFLVIVIASPMVNPAVVLRFLPEDVREAAKDHLAPPKYKQIIAHILLAIFLIAMFVGIIYVGINGIKSHVCGILEAVSQVYCHAICHGL
ncbi:MAG: hypothetical protein K6B68_13330 [Eubacterium sp.]|nr:hypothetical protein [Eubacterium sp.]